jgi:hypothetical protein
MSAEESAEGMGGDGQPQTAEADAAPAASPADALKSEEVSEERAAAGVVPDDSEPAEAGAAVDGGGDEAGTAGEPRRDEVV